MKLSGRHALCRVEIVDELARALCEHGEIIPEWDALRPSELVERVRARVLAARADDVVRARVLAERSESAPAGFPALARTERRDDSEASSERVDVFAELRRRARC